jgi:phosphatidylinositol phospholipase C delta
LSYTTSTMSDRIQSWAEDLRHLQEQKGVDSLIHIQPPEDKEVRLSPEVLDYLKDNGEVRLSHLLR